MLQDLKTKVPDNGCLGFLCQLQTTGDTDGTLLLKLLTELKRNKDNNEPKTIKWQHGNERGKSETLGQFGDKRKNRASKLPTASGELSLESTGG